MFIDKIDQFVRYKKTPNAICAGALYLSELTFKSKVGVFNKTIRVYLPSNYDFNNSDNRYPVIYMCDGQNIVDKYTTQFGEWNIDEEIQKAIENNLHKGIIVVGIDCPTSDEQRMNELCPSMNHLIPTERHGISYAYGDDFASFIVNDVKPLIDKVFFTKKDKLNTGIGGSSMGGLESFFIGIKHKETFGFSLCFSPAFLLYKSEELKEEIKKINPTDLGKFYFYVGGTEFESEFVNNMNIVFNELVNILPTNSINYVYEYKGIHHESYWQKYFLDALLFLRP